MRLKARGTSTRDLAHRAQARGAENAGLIAIEMPVRSGGLQRRGVSNAAILARSTALRQSVLDCYARTPPACVEELPRQRRRRASQPRWDEICCCMAGEIRLHKRRQSELLARTGHG
jgi:hypothetical protein